MNEAPLDLRAVDELCRLATTVRRLGCEAHVVGGDPELHELLELAGVADVLLRCPSTHLPDPDPADPGGDLP